MAKRRKLEAPTAEDLTRFEEEFRRETGPRSAVAPIAQVAAEAANAMDLRPAPVRAEAARDRQDAQALRDAQAKGLVLLDLALDDVHADALVRDRISLAPEDMAELQSSIARNGLRLPIEVFALEPSVDGAAYGLLSGYRRLMAMRALHQADPEGGFARIKAVLRDPAQMGGAFSAMVEENEIRAALSQFERGRIAVVTTQQGAFASVDAAVDALFPVASKSKRSKIRSFALIFEELGDMLRFPDQLKEREGLALATALRNGAGAKLRQRLADAAPDSPEAEALILAEGQGAAATRPADPSRGGRPARQVGPKRALKSGVVLQSREDAKGWQIQITGPGVDRAKIEAALKHLEDLF